MEVLLVNESVGKSLVKTRRILSELLPQLGQNVFCGHIDSIGLRNLHERLKKSASKATSVTCHLVSTRGTEFLWSVGNTKSFDDHGRFSFRQLKAKVPPASPKTDSAFFSLLRNAVRLAALFHDLGKASELFQAKLRSTSGAHSEPLRHELLSYLMLTDALDPEADEATTDHAWLERLVAHPERVGRHVTNESLLSPAGVKVAKDLVTGASRGKKFLGALGKTRTSRPLTAGVLWMVLTHHKLPGTKEEDNLARHTHPERMQDAKAFPSNLKPATGTPPWQDKRWLESVRAVADELLAALRELDATSKGLLYTSQWPLAVSHLGRPALVLGDYKASILKKESHPLTTPDLILANTRDASLGGDSLATHLLSVKSAASLLFKLQRKVSTSFATTSVPAHCTTGIRSNELPERFLWQKTAADKIREICQQHPAAGFFATAISGTGAGKTIGGVRIMDAACGSVLRYSLPLSRKSLTLQAGMDYRADTGLVPGAVAVAIGSRVTKVLGDLTARGSDSLVSELGFAQKGRASLNVDEDILLDYAGAGNLQEAWRAYFEGADEELFKTKKSLDIISAPILITTADHLTAGVELLNGKGSLLLLRLMSADLVIDEGDNYSAKDLVSLGKMVFIAGMFGRKVVLMSATLAQPIVEAFYSAYCKGLELAGLLKGEPMEHVCAVVSNEAAPFVEVGSTPPAFMTAYRAQVKTFLANVEAKPLKRTVGVLDVGATRSAQECFDKLGNEVHALHSGNKLVDPKTGVAYSVGFVRFNTAKTCFSASQYLASTASAFAAEHKTAIKFVTYHAKQTLLGLSVIDKVLGRVLKRSATGDLTHHVEISTVLEEVAQEGLTDVVIVVLTTSLLETGRDQDYDWCILEPRSNRGEHQAMGRVRRHRHELWLTQNVSVLSHTIRQLAQGKSGWGLPGVERKGTAYEVVSLLPSTLRPLAKNLGIAFQPSGQFRTLVSAQEALPVAQWIAKVSPRQCLEVPASYEENPIGALEQLEMYAHLLDCGDLSKEPDGVFPGPPAEPKPLIEYLSPPSSGLPLSWCAQHSLKTKFRSSADQRFEFQVFFNPKSAPGLAKVADPLIPYREVALPHIEGITVPESAYWLDMPELIEASWKELKAAMPESDRLYQEAHGARISSFAQSHQELKGEYSPYLGFSIS